MKTELYQRTKIPKRDVIYWYFKNKPTIEGLKDIIKEWEIYITEFSYFLQHDPVEPRYLKNKIKIFKYELKIFKEKLKKYT
jgi:hypothetical protein